MDPPPPPEEEKMQQPRATAQADPAVLDLLHNLQKELDEIKSENT